MTARAYHHGSLREELLDRAERTLAERGLGALSLRELAREAGVSHAAPRRHFADRQELLDAVATRGFERLEAELHAAGGDGTEPFALRFAAAANAHVGFATGHAALLDLMFSAKHGPVSDALAEASHRAFGVFSALIEEGQELGLIEAGDAERVGVPLFAAVHGLAALLNSGLVVAQEREVLVAEVAAQALRGARPAERDDRRGRPAT